MLHAWNLSQVIKLYDGIQVHETDCELLVGMTWYGILQETFILEIF